MKAFKLRNSEIFYAKITFPLRSAHSKILSSFPANQMTLPFMCVKYVWCIFPFSGILTELCDLNDACNLDEKAFKGIFVRNLRYLMDASQHIDLFHIQSKAYTAFLERNVEALLANASCVPERNDNDRLR